ncbi:hypothetical protein HPC49_06440, partial [Pyxidicoccus fallax]|nr:hypothetical protein [Pyxidicoccus fallax]
MLRNPVVRALALTAMAWVAGLGCGGGTLEAEPERETGNAEQEIGYCGPPNYTCPPSG